MKESKFRTKLAQYPATKLLIKALIDLSKLDFYQFKNSVDGWYQTSICHIQRFIKNKETVKCNFCNWKGNIFFPHVTNAGVIKNEKCPVCHSIPRYRSLMNFLLDDLQFFDKKLKILEVGPNRSLQSLLIKNENFDYISVDLKSPQAMIHMDVTDLKFDDDSFDLVFCIGVMHYVDDDKKGFSELYRVLKPSGKLIIASGMNEKSQTTVNYPKRTPQNNFTVRMYGWDVEDKFQEAGFKIEKYNPYNKASDIEKVKFGLGSHTFFLLTK